MITSFEVVVGADLVDGVDGVSDRSVDLLVLDVHSAAGVGQVL